MTIAIGFEAVERVEGRHGLGPAIMLYSVTELRNGEPVRLFTGQQSECMRFVRVYRSKLAHSKRNLAIKMHQKRVLRGWINDGARPGPPVHIVRLKHSRLPTVDEDGWR